MAISKPFRLTGNIKENNRDTPVWQADSRRARRDSCRSARSAGMVSYSRINESISTTRMVTIPCAKVAAVWAL